MIFVNHLRNSDKNLQVFNLEWENAGLEYKKLETDIQDLQVRIAALSEDSIRLRTLLTHMLEQKTERKFLLTVHMNKLRQERKGIVS